MAREITVTAGLTAYKSSVMSSELARALTAVQVTMAGMTFVSGRGGASEPVS